MTALDWYTVDQSVQWFSGQTTVWMYDIQEYLRISGVTHPCAFHEACALLRRVNIKVLNSD